jgi:DNA-binding NarL/FixJ family response regulator
MVVDLRVAVLERGAGLTHELALACRGAHIDILGPISRLDRVAVPARAAAVVVVEHTGLLDASLRDVVAALPDARILAMTDAPDPAVTAGIVAMGASGVLDRRTERRVLIDALRRAAAGELVVPAAHLPALMELSAIARSVDERATRMRTLTRREREVLALLAGGRSTAEIAAVLAISALTVQSHVKNILAKLGVHSKVEAMRYGWRAGALDVPMGA